MPGEPSPFVLLLLLTAMLSLAVTALVLRRRPARPALAFTVITLGSAWYALCYAVALASLTLPEKAFWYRMMYVGVLALPGGLLAFAYYYTQPKSWVSRPNPLWLTIEPAITLALIWTNEHHRWVWTRIWLEPSSGWFVMPRVSYGPWFWIHLLYSYALALLALMILGQAFLRSSHLHRRQLGILFVSVALPMLGYVLVFSDRNPIAPVDPVPILAALGITLAAWALQRFRLFELLPVARHAVVDQIDEGVVAVNAEGYIVDINNAALHLLERTQTQVIGQPASALLPFYDHVVRGQQDLVDRQEITWPATDPPRYFDLHMSPLRDRDGRLAGRLLVLHDITGPKEAEAEARQRNQQLTILYDTALEFGSELDLSRLLDAITSRAMQLLHASTADLSLYRPDSDDLQAAVLYGVPSDFNNTVIKRGEGLSGKILESGAPLVVEDYRTWPGRAAVYEGQPFGPMVGVPLKWGGRVLGTLDVARPSGPGFTADEVRLLSLFGTQAAVAIENARLYAHMQRELSERRQAEEQLRRWSQALGTLYDTALEVASRLDLAQLLPTIVERAALLLHATGCGMYLHQPASDTLQYAVAHGLNSDTIGHTLHRGEGISGRVFDSGEPMYVDDYHHWPGRSPLFDRQDIGAIVAVPVRWGKRVLGVIDLQRARGDSFTTEEIRLLTLFATQAAIALDNAQLYEAARRELAERKIAEAQLRASEQRYRAVVEDQTDHVTRFTPDCRVTFVNEAVCRFLGLTREQIIGRGVLGDVPPEDHVLVYRALASITRETPVASAENRVVDKDGQLHWFQWTDRGIFDEQGTLIEYQSVGRDISERRQAEEEREKLQARLQQAQRMETVGALAGGIAHEFNNLLTVIEGNVELMMADLAADDPQRQPLATVARTAQRAATLTRQLLAFSRRQVLERREVDLNRVLVDFAPMLRHGLGPAVQLHLEPAPGCGPILADAGAIEQVLMNLALNARDAMPEGGDLRISTAPATLSEEFCRTHGDIKPGEYVRLTVIDTGQGMSADTLRHMFEPFFTTKEVGKGTGLGLSVVYGIVRQHAGWIEVQSEAGQGARFDVYLPVYAPH